MTMPITMTARGPASASAWLEVLAAIEAPIAT
jgi:hypothetical protein